AAALSVAGRRRRGRWPVGGGGRHGCRGRLHGCLVLAAALGLGGRLQRRTQAVLGLAVGGEVALLQRGLTVGERLAGIGDRLRDRGVPAATTGGPVAGGLAAAALIAGRGPGAALEHLVQGLTEVGADRDLVAEGHDHLLQQRERRTGRGLHVQRF